MSLEYEPTRNRCTFLGAGLGDRTPHTTTPHRTPKTLYVDERVWLLVVGVWVEEVPKLIAQVMRFFQWYPEHPQFLQENNTQGSVRLSVETPLWMGKADECNFNVVAVGPITPDCWKGLPVLRPFI